MPPNNEVPAMQTSCKKLVIVHFSFLNEGLAFGLEVPSLAV